MNINKRHRWSHPIGRVKDAGVRGGVVGQCIKCGCVREPVNGFLTYEIDGKVYDKFAPPCDERLLKHQS